MDERLLRIIQCVGLPSAHFPFEHVCARISVSRRSKGDLHAVPAGAELRVVKRPEEEVLFRKHLTDA